VGNTPDRFPGPLEDEEIRLVADSGEPSEPGAMKYSGTSFQLRDSVGTFNPRTGSSFDPGVLVITSAGSLVYDSNGELALKAEA
jgi:hypothetical protein